MKKIICVGLIFVVMLIGCDSTNQAIVTSTPDLLSTSFASPTKTLIPSHTPVTTKTPTLIATLNPTQKVVATIFESTAIAESTQTFIVQEAIQSAELDLTNDCNAWHISLSPDKNWLARDCHIDNMFRVSKTDGSKNFEISHKEVAELIGYSDASIVSDIFTLFWTKDGRFLFFTGYLCCADTDAFGWNGSLFRLNLKTGEWAEMISGSFNYFAFSPTEHKLIHIPSDLSGNGHPVIVNIINLETWSQDQILLDDFEQAGRLVWSPDENSLVLVAKTGNIYDDNQKFSIIVLDLKTKSSKVISHPNYMYPVSWSENNIITLMGVSCAKDNPYSCYDILLFYDMNLGEFVSAP